MYCLLYMHVNAVIDTSQLNIQKMVCSQGPVGPACPNDWPLPDRNVW